MGEPLTLDCGHGVTVSGLVDRPKRPVAWLTLAHGAGAGMTHPFMASVAEGLSRRGIGVLRYNFPFMERGGRRPDAPGVAKATVRAAVRAAADLAGPAPLLAGGKSFGARMTSEAAAEAPLAGVRGLIFLGFPLHPAGKPAVTRAAHLARVTCPMLFLQGTRDTLADLALLTKVVDTLNGPVTLSIIDDADHSFHVRAASGRTDNAARDDMLDRLRAWIDETLAGKPIAAHTTPC